MKVSLINKRKNLLNKKIKLDPDNDPYYNINIEGIKQINKQIFHKFQKINKLIFHFF